MARKIISLGSGPNTKTGDSAREGGKKINENFEELYGMLQVLVAAASKTYDREEMQVFKKKLPDDVDYLEEQQVGDFCIGFVINDDEEVEFVTAEYIGGDATRKSSYYI